MGLSKLGKFIQMLERSVFEIHLNYHEKHEFGFK